MRATSARSAACSASMRWPICGRLASTLNAKWLRSAAKPECISAVTERASARAAARSGHSCSAGKRSARYSAIASVSQIACGVPSITVCSAGTLPVGLIPNRRRLNSESGANESKRTIASSKSMPAWRISTHGRIDHDE